MNMNMKTVTINYPEDILLILNESSETFTKKVKLLAAIKLYELGQISLGIAAELAGIEKVDLIMELSKYNVSLIKYSLESLQDEINTVKELINEN